MTASDLLRTGSLGLRTRRTRATLSALGVAIGIASMVGVLGISESSRADLIAQLDQLGTNLLRVAPGQSFRGEDAELPESAAAMIGRVSGVQATASTKVIADATVRRTHLIDEAETGGISVAATDPSLLSTLGAELARGTFLTRANAGYPVVVLGAEAAERLGDETREAGRVRRVQLEHLGRAGEPFEVLGEPERAPAVHAQRLERRPAAQHARVVRMQPRTARVDDAVPQHGKREWLRHLSRISRFGSAAGSPSGSASRDHSRVFHAGAGVAHSERGTKRDRSTSCSLWM